MSRVKRGLGDAPNYFAEDGARELARIIIAYWAARGCLVKVTVEPVAGSSRFSGGLLAYGLRSDMINGAPRDYERAAGL